MNFWLLLLEKIVMYGGAALRIAAPIAFMKKYEEKRKEEMKKAVKNKERVKIDEINRRAASQMGDDLYDLVSPGASTGKKLIDHALDNLGKKFGNKLTTDDYLKNKYPQYWKEIEKDAKLGRKNPFKPPYVLSDKEAEELKEALKNELKKLENNFGNIINQLPEGDFENLKNSVSNTMNDLKNSINTNGFQDSLKKTDSDVKKASKDLSDTLRLANNNIKNAAQSMEDLDSDGIETTTIGDGIYFDQETDGFAEKSSWADNSIIMFDKYYIKQTA